MNQLAPLIKKGSIGIIPTDTIYGIVGSALKKSAIDKIYRARKRDTKKPCIVLISSYNDLKKFGIKLSTNEARILKKLWPGPVSIVFETNLKKFSYLHRGANSIAFRVPDNKYLLALLKKSGPLVAPSANLAGKKPAKSAFEALEIFGSQIDFYVDEGVIRKTKPSTLIKLNSEMKTAYLLRLGTLPKNKLRQSLPKDWKIKSQT